MHNYTHYHYYHYQPVQKMNYHLYDTRVVVLKSDIILIHSCTR